MYVIVCMGKFKYQPKNMAKIIMRKYFAIPLLTQIVIVFSVISNKYCTCTLRCVDSNPAVVPLSWSNSIRAIFSEHSAQ